MPHTSGLPDVKPESVRWPVPSCPPYVVPEQAVTLKRQRSPPLEPDSGSRMRGNSSASVCGHHLKSGGRSNLPGPASRLTWHYVSWPQQHTIRFSSLPTPGSARARKTLPHPPPFPVPISVWSRAWKGGGGGLAWFWHLIHSLLFFTKLYRKVLGIQGTRYHRGSTYPMSGVPYVCSFLLDSQPRNHPSKSNKLHFLR